MNDVDQGSGGDLQQIIESSAEGMLRGRGLDIIATLGEHQQRLTEAYPALEERQQQLRQELEGSLSPAQLELLTRYVVARDQLVSNSAERRGINRSSAAMLAVQQALLREFNRNNKLSASNERLNAELGGLRSRISHEDAWRR